MNQISLSVETRESKGSGKAGRLRAAGKIPAVAYSKDEHRMLTVDRRAFRDLQKEIAGSASLIALNDGAGWETLSVLQDIQVDPISDQVIHIDFQTVSAGVEMTSSVPVSIVGTAKGLEDGGVLDQSLYEVDIRCLPKDFPEAIEVDVSELGVGDSLHVGALAVPKGVTILTEGDLSLVAVTAPAEVPAEGEETEEVAADEVPVVGEDNSEGEAAADEGEDKS